MTLCLPLLPRSPPAPPLCCTSGFAFVDFATKQEARNAMDAVGGAHLYGRRLVMEWAEEEGGLDELRAKTGAGGGREKGEGAGRREGRGRRKRRRQWVC